MRAEHDLEASEAAETGELVHDGRVCLLILVRYLQDISGLGGLYESQGRYSEAELLYLEAMEGMRTELGERHPHTLASINSLGELYRSQGRYADAEPLLVEALNGSRMELVERHPGNLQSINSLGNLYIEMKNFLSMADI